MPGYIPLEAEEWEKLCRERKREKKGEGEKEQEGRAQSDEITSAFLNKSFINRACGLLFVCWHLCNVLVNTGYHPLDLWWFSLRPRGMGMIITLSRISHNQSTSHTFFLFVFSVPHFSSSQENSQRKNELLLETTSKKFTILKTTDQVLCTTQWPWATNCYHADNLFQSQFLQDLWVVFSQSLQLARYAGECFQSPKPCNTWG